MIRRLKFTLAFALCSPVMGTQSGDSSSSTDHIQKYTKQATKFYHEQKKPLQIGASLCALTAFLYGLYLYLSSSSLPFDQEAIIEDADQRNKYIRKLCDTKFPSSLKTQKRDANCMESPYEMQAGYFASIAIADKPIEACQAAWKAIENKQYLQFWGSPAQETFMCSILQTFFGSEKLARHTTTTLSKKPYDESVFQEYVVKYLAPKSNAQRLLEKLGFSSSRKIKNMDFMLKNLNMAEIESKNIHDKKLVQEYENIYDLYKRTRKTHIEVVGKRNYIKHQSSNISESHIKALKTELEDIKNTITQKKKFERLCQIYEKLCNKAEEKGLAGWEKVSAFQKQPPSSQNISNIEQESKKLNESISLFEQYTTTYNDYKASWNWLQTNANMSKLKQLTKIQSIKSLKKNNTSLVQENNEIELWRPVISSYQALSNNLKEMNVTLAPFKISSKKSTWKNQRIQLNTEINNVSQTYQTFQKKLTDIKTKQKTINDKIENIQGKEVLKEVLKKQLDCLASFVKNNTLEGPSQVVSLSELGEILQQSNDLISKESKTIEKNIVSINTCLNNLESAKKWQEFDLYTKNYDETMKNLKSQKLENEVYLLNGDQKDFFEFLLRKDFDLASQKESSKKSAELYIKDFLAARTYNKKPWLVQWQST